MSDRKTVEIQRSPTKGFGFSVIGGSNTHLPPMICALVYGGPAASSGKIEVGDLVEEVNGINARDLPTRSIVDIVRKSNEKIVLTLSRDPEATRLAQPFLSNEPTGATPREGRASRFASYSSKRPQEIKISIDHKTQITNNKGLPNNIKKSNSKTRYERTVGSPDYERLGADGRFVKSGSLDRPPVNFKFDKIETGEKISAEDEESSSKSDECSINSDQSSVNSFASLTPSDNQENTEVVDGLVNLFKCSSPSTGDNRLSKPIFGSSPRLGTPPLNQRNMKSNYSSSNLPNIVVDNMQRPITHRRSASNDEQTLNYYQRQPQTQDYRAPIHSNSNNPQSVSDSGRFSRSGQTVRFEEHSNQKSSSASWSSYQGKDQQRAGAMLGNGSAVQAYGAGKSATNAQELRNAFVKHQIALRNQKLAGISQRQYNSHEELPSFYSSPKFANQNGPTQNWRGIPIGKDPRMNQQDNYVNDCDDEDDMQRSGYGVGFRRTNSLGRADMYQRYSRNHDFYFSDRTHPKNYKENHYHGRSEASQSAQSSRFSPALQQRLLNATSSSMTSSYAKANGGGIPSGHSSQFANMDDCTAGQSSARNFTYATQNSAISINSSNGVTMRETEDGMVQSRYEHGKSLAVPTQSFQEEFFSSSGDNSDVYDKNRASFSSRNSIGSRMSDLGGAEFSSPMKIPTDLKTVNPTDLATKLFMLDGFSSDEVAPLLGKNTEFSQQVCNEYMKFLNFEGYAIDEAIRILLQKFPLTGETQERERILLQFSKRYHECNRQLYGSEDSVHTLVCALMLLNTDLHGQNIGTKMTLNEFINNLSGLKDGEDFSKELLKTLYQSIKNKEIQYTFNETPREIKPSLKGRKSSSKGNPFVELKTDDDAVLMREGMMYRKCIMESDGRRFPAHKRRWKMYFCMLKGLVLFLQKPDKGPSDQSIGIHHSLAGFATDYKKRTFVFKLITADWRVFMFEAKSKSDVQDWVDSINLSASALSSPPLPAPCSSSNQFSRPVMPVSVTRLSLEEQIKRHAERAESIDKEMQEHRDNQPNENSKIFKDWENKMDYLEFEYKRFSAYIKVLSTPRLKEKLSFLLSNRNKSVTRTDEAPSNRPLRSSSMNDIERSHNASPNTRRTMRQSYIRAVQS